MRYCKRVVIKGHILNRYIDRLGNLYNEKETRITPNLINGRLYVYGDYEGGSHSRRLDYLVAENFMEKPINPIRLIHVDDDPFNCCIDNLHWLTREDIVDKYQTEYGLDESFGCQEVWRTIETPMGYIAVSTFGRTKNPNTDEQIPQYDSHGYKVIYYTPPGDGDKETKALFVHRLVAIAFIPNPEKYEIVNHMDADKKNCHVWNLEWCNISMNTEHAYLHDRVGSNNITQLHETCRLMAEGKLSDVEIALVTGIDRKTISDMRRLRRHVNIVSQYKLPEKKWSKELSMKVVDLVNAGHRGREVLELLNIPVDQSAISFYERTRRQYKHLITKAA